MRNQWIAVWSISILVMLASMARAGNPLDGTWVIRLEPDADSARIGAKPFDDTLLMERLHLTSTALKKFGFGRTLYDLDARGAAGPARFECDAAGDSGHSARWTGTATGAAIQGELTWTRPDGKIWKFTYKGEKK